MYGFHKVNDMFHANPSSESQAWEFKHPEFRRGAVDQLQNIRRKSSKSVVTNPGNIGQGTTLLKAATTANAMSAEDVDRDDRVDMLNRQVVDLDDKLRHIQKGYESLYSEMLALKNFQSRTQQVTKV